MGNVQHITRFLKGMDKLVCLNTSHSNAPSGNDYSGMCCVMAAINSSAV